MNMIDQQLFDGSVELSGQTDLAQDMLALPASRGVCLFAGSENQPILLVHGANIRALVRRRLAENQPDQKTRRTKLAPVTARLWFRRAGCAFETELAHFQIARAVYPQTYRDLFPRLALWLITIDPEVDYPVFTVTDRIPPPPKQMACWGPFPTKRSACRYLETLQDMFDLCRCPEIIANAPHGTRCSYAQMNRCAAFCDGSASQQDYHRSIDRAIEMLNCPTEVITHLAQQMQDCAAARQYEQAQHVKNRIALARKLCAPALAWVTRMDSFCVLAFQPGPPVKLPETGAAEPSVCPFILGPGWIDQIEPFPVSAAEEGCADVIDHVQLTRFGQTTGSPRPSQPELFAWVANRLYRKSSEKGLYVSAQGVPDTAELARQVTDRFTRIPKPPRRPKLDSASLIEQDPAEDPTPPQQEGPN